MAVDVTVEDHIASVRIDHGRVNALDLELCDALAREFERLDRSADVAAIVLTGHGGSFCAGVDLRRLSDESPAYTRTFLSALTDVLLAVFRTTCPTVAAVNGHAIAGGCVLAGACDHVVAAEDAGRIGLSELAVGVPFPVAALEIVRSRVGAALAEAVLHATTYDPEQALRLGFVDELVPSPQLSARAHEVATALARIPASTYDLTKQQLHHPAESAIGAMSSVVDPHVRAAWQSDEIRERIRTFLERLRRSGQQR